MKIYKGCFNFNSIYWLIKYFLDVDLKMLYKLWIKNSMFMRVIDFLVKYLSLRRVGFRILFDILNIMNIL